MKLFFLVTMTFLSGLTTASFWLLKQEEFKTNHGKKVRLALAFYPFLSLILLFFHLDSSPLGLMYFIAIISFTISYKDFKYIYLDTKLTFTWYSFFFLLLSFAALFFMVFKEIAQSISH